MRNTIEVQKKVRKMTHSKFQKYLAEMEVGTFLLRSLRKVNNHDPKTNKKEPFKVSIEGRQLKTSPHAGGNQLLAMINNFTGRPRVGWLTGLPSIMLPMLGVSQEDFDALEVFSASEIPEPAQKEGTHYLWLGYVNPTINGKHMQLSVYEYTDEINPRGVQTNKQLATPKMNPSNGEVQTVDGVDIYSRTSIILSDLEVTDQELPEDVWLKSDQQIGRVSIGQREEAPSERVTVKS